MWGSTFFAIRVGVQEVPPFLLAALRFLVAGLLLYGWTLARGERPPSPRQWLSACLLAVLIFLVYYGGVFWAEQRVPSGITAVLLAMTSGFMALAEIIFLRTQKLTVRLSVALLIGLAGVAVMVNRSLDLGGIAIDMAGAIALLVAQIGWALSSVLARKLPQHSSDFMGSGAQMLAGGVLLLLASAALGEFRGFHPGAISARAWLALAYLVVAGSIVAFTAYVWLIRHESPTKVGTFAYVNPVVAVLVGYFLGGEALDVRTVTGALCVLLSVAVIATMKAKPRETTAA